jgi:hypothetical protein
MTITRISQGTNGYATGNTTSTSLSVTLQQTPILGNVLIATVGTFNWQSIITVSSITQTGVAWTLQTAKSVVLAANYSLDSEIWLGIVGAGASTSISITLSGSLAFLAIADICEYSGVLTSGMLDKTASNSGFGASNTSSTGQTATTTQDSELEVGSMLVGYGGQTAPILNSFTLLDGNYLNNAASLAYLEKIVTITGTAETGTTGVSWLFWCGCIATFKGATGIQKFCLINEMGY